MILRAFLDPTAGDVAEFVGLVDAVTAAAGAVTSRRSEPAPNMPELREETWVITPTPAPDDALDQLIDALGGEWHADYVECAVLVLGSGGPSSHPTVHSMFLDIEAADRGRESGVAPKFEQGQAVTVAPDSHILQAFPGRPAVVAGRAFDVPSLTWSYVVEIEGDEFTWYAEDGDLVACAAAD